MAKVCKWEEGCCWPVFSKGLCRNHWGMTYGKPLNRFKPLVQTEDSRTARPFRIEQISKKRQAALARYRRLRDKYFEEHPVCEFTGCISRNITLHHKRGRLGSFLTDKRYFCSLCKEHHVWVETHPAEAKKMGLSDSRLENGVMLPKAS